MTEDIDKYEASIKYVLGGGLLIFGGTVFAKLTGFLRQFIIIRMLSPEQYGLFALGLTFLTLAAGLGNLGLYPGSQRYIAYYDSKGDKSMVKGTTRSTLRIILFSGLVTFAILVLLSEPLSSLLDKPDFRNVLLIFCFAIPLAMYSHIIISFFLGFRRADVVVLLNDALFGALSVLFIYLSLLIWRDTTSPVYALLATYAVLLIASFYLYWIIIHPRLRGVEPARITKALLLFSLPLFFSGVSYIILNNTDTLMLGYYMPSEAVGFYNAAFLLMSFMALFLNSFAVIFMPVLSGLVARELHKEARSIYQAVTKWIYLLTLPLIFTFFFFPSEVLTLLFSSPYAQAGTALAILVAAEFLHTTLGPNEQALIAYGATKTLLVSYSVAAVSNIILNVVLIPRMGISGAATATGISLIILNLFNSSFLYFKFRVHPFGRKFLIPLLLCVGAGGAFYLPLKALVDRSPWFVFICYPIFLALGGIFTLITKSYSEEDLLIYRAIKNRLGRARS